MSTAQRFEDLEIWQIARELAIRTFSLAKTTELSKDYRLKDQMNAAAGSVMDNIAEGFGRGSRLEFIQFLSVATGSIDELKSQLYRCLDRNYLPEALFDELYQISDKLYRKIKAMISYLNQSNVKGQKFRNRTKAKAQQTSNPNPKP